MQKLTDGVVPLFFAHRAAGGRWTLDWEGMETAMKEHPEVALFMLCNPFNPVGEPRLHRMVADRLVPP